MKKSVGATTILYPHPVLLVGTFSEDGKPNLCAVSWGGICCSKPPMVAISLREATLTHGNIRRRGAFTVGIPSEDQVRIADFAGSVSGRDVDKITAMGLTAVTSDHVDAPRIEELPYSLECRVAATHELGLHTQFVGEILDLVADESVLDSKGQPDIEKVRPILYATGNRRYYGIGEGLIRAFTVKEW